MPYNRPPLAELQAQTAQDINATVGGADSRLAKSVLAAISNMVAAGLHQLYGYLAWLVLQAFATTAIAEYLDQEADELGLSRLPATAATGTMVATGSNGNAIPLDTIVQRADGVQYKTTASAVIASGTATVAIQAITTGITGNGNSGTQLAFVSPIAGVNATATSNVLAGGAAIESDKSLRNRLLLRKRQPPQGGALGDYDQWVRRLPGLTRAWVSPNEAGLNTTTVRFMMDATYPNGVPSAGDATNLLAILSPLKPVTLQLFVSPPVAEPLNFTVTISPNTPETQAAVAAELADLIKRDASPGGTLLISRIREAVSIAAGETDNTVTLPAGNVTASSGSHIFTMGTITWV
jgi:uncharacterized phage protein gp47/JayE